MSEEKAISVYEEAKELYLAGYKDLPEPIKRRMSPYQKDQIWELMVLPAIELVRKLDKEDMTFELDIDEEELDALVDEVVDEELNGKHRD